MKNIQSRLFFLIVLSYSFAVVDYLARSADDFLKYSETCGSFTDLYESGPRIRSTTGLMVKIKSAGRVYKFRIRKELEKIKRLLTPFLGGYVCVRYVRPPVFKFLKYPIEIFSKNQIVVTKEELRLHYLNRSFDYIFWFFSLIVAYFAPFLLKSRR